MSKNRAISVGTVLAAGCLSAALATTAFAGTRKPAATANSEHPLAKFLQITEKSRKALAAVDDYTALFVKMEVVRGRKYPHSMAMKFRSKPFSVYLYFTDKHKGRRVLYVEGQNGGKLLAKDGGFGAIVGTIALLPDSPKAMEEGRYPITKIGMANMLQAVVVQWKQELNSPHIRTKMMQGSKLKPHDRRLPTMECYVLESEHTKQEKGVEFFRTRLYLDMKTHLPVRVEQYGFPKRAGRKPPLLAEYTYWNLKTNVDLKDADFSRNNPQYGL
jgi:Protein of unknown function (DUF1571)